MMENIFENGFFSGGILNLSPKQTFDCCKRGAVLVDVREANMNRFKMFDVPEVIYCPYSLLKETFQNLPVEKPLIFADSSGLHSREAVIFLIGKGISNHLANMAGGIVEWERDELPLIIDKHEKLSGSCMCQLKPRDKKEK